MTSTARFVLIAFLLPLSSLIAWAQDDPSGSWFLDADSDYGQRRIAITCYSDGRGTVQASQGAPKKPARCRRYGDELEVRAWDSDDAVNYGQTPAKTFVLTVKPDGSIDGYSYDGNVVDIPDYLTGEPASTSASRARSQAALDSIVSSVRQAQGSSPYAGANSSSSGGNSSSGSSSSQGSQNTPSSSSYSSGQSAFQDFGADADDFQPNALSGQNLQPVEAPDWSSNKLTACGKTGENLPLLDSRHDHSKAVEAFKASCQVMWRSRFTTVSGKVRCDRQGEFNSAVEENLSEKGLAGYSSYGKQVWGVWLANMGCLKR